MTEPEDHHRLTEPRLGGHDRLRGLPVMRMLGRRAVRAVMIPLALVAGPASCTTAQDGAGPPGTGSAGGPETFFAVRRIGVEIVEVDSDSGRVRRTVVDLGANSEVVSATGGLIDALDLPADRRALFYSRSLPGPGSVFRIELPDGAPERIAEGYAASVSPDGRRLALVRGTELVIREVESGQERGFPDVVGELGAARTAWSADSRRVAVEISGADVSVVDMVDADTGEVTDLHPLGELEVNYRVIAPGYRPSERVLAVVCCHDGELVGGEPPQNTELVLHDPRTGAERSRMGLPFSAWDFDWDASGSVLLFTDGDRVHRYSGGRFRTVPAVHDVYALAW